MTQSVRVVGDRFGVTVEPQLTVQYVTSSDLTSREMGSDDPPTVTDIKAAVADFIWATDSDLSSLSRKSFSRNQRRRASEQSDASQIG